MDWCCALPYDADDSLVAKLEEGANAAVIPRLSVYAKIKGFDKPVVNDIKKIILKNEPADAVGMVTELIT